MQMMLDAIQSRDLMTATSSLMLNQFQRAMCVSLFAETFFQSRLQSIESVEQVRLDVQSSSIDTSIVDYSN